MKSFYRLPAVFCICIMIIFSSCKKSNMVGRYLPETASAAMVINAESLSAKLPWETIKQNELFKQLYADSSMEAYMKAALDNPENTGIDIKKNLLFFVEKDSLGGYFGFEGTVKDADKFKQFNTNATKATEVEKNGIHFLSTADITVSWDKDKFVIIADAPQMSKDSRFSKTGSRDAVAAATNIYSLKKSHSLAEDDKFTELVGKKGDVHFWVNIGALSDGAEGMAQLRMINLNKFSENSFLTGVANFENGKIEVDIKSYSGLEMTEINKKYSGAKLDKEMIKRIPSKDLSMLVAFSFKTEGLRELIKMTGTEGLINLAATKLGFTFDDFVKANKGDILFALSDVRRDTSGKPAMNALFTASIGDKNAFGKLTEAGKKMMAGDQTGSKLPPLFYNSSNEYFALGTDKPTVDKYVGTNSNYTPEFMDKISGSSVFYLNVRSLLNGMSDETKRDSLDKIVFDATINMCDNILATSGGFKDGGTTQHIEINLVDKNTNSFLQLNNYLGTLGSIQQQKKMKREKWMNDAMSENATDSSDILKADPMSR